MTRTAGRVLGRIVSDTLLMALKPPWANRTLYAWGGAVINDGVNLKARFDPIYLLLGGK